MKATEKDIRFLCEQYKDRSVYQGELHDHAATGGTSDGECTLTQWREKLKEFQMDFAAILDHRQVRHMYLPEWEDGLFIGATEPGTFISDSKAEYNEMHYNMLLAKPGDLESLLEEFPEYKFTGGSEGHFEYPDFTTERFGEVINAVKARGGLFVHPHPKQLMKSDDPCDYWFQDETGIEVVYRALDSKYTKPNYELWTGLLAAGKRVWACAGGDRHESIDDKALTTIYAEERTSESFLRHLSKGDFTCGAVGIRMCIGDTKMGGKGNFDGLRLVCCVSDFHRSVYHLDHNYRVDILNQEGVVFSQEISCDEPTWIAMDTQDCDFYRVEVIDETLDLRIAIGNPIWNER